MKFFLKKKTYVDIKKMHNQTEAEGELPWKDSGGSPIPLGTLEQGWPSRVVPH